MAELEEPIAEAVELPSPEPAPTELVQDPVRPPRRPSMVGPVLGGVIAAAIGFGAAQLVPNGWPVGDTTALEAQLTAQTAEIEAVKTRIAQLSEAPAANPDQALTDRVTALEAAAPQGAPDLSAMTDRLAAMEQRLAASESLPTDGSAPSSAALAQIQSDLAALKSGDPSATALKSASDAIDAKLAEAETAIAAIKTDAEATAKSAATRAALQQVAAALDSGSSFNAALTALPEDLAPILKDHAAAGLPTLQTLRQTFPAAARAALEASLRADMGDSWTARVTAFLNNQTGARSLTPREGSDPDAVLSRAEAALNAGDLATTLTELAALPPEGQAAMADWQALAAQRQEAISALQSLAAGLGG